MVSPSGDKVSHMVVELSNPQLSGNDLSYDVKVLEGTLLAKGGACALFIDVIGMRRTPYSFAGAEAFIGDVVAKHHIAMFGFQVDHTAAEFTPFLIAEVCASLLFLGWNRRWASWGEDTKVP